MAGFGDTLAKSFGFAEEEATTPGINLTVSRHNVGPRLFFYDADDQPHAIPVHVIPTFQESSSAIVTDFPVEDGTDISEHVIQFPSILKLEIVQSMLPFETVEDNGQLVEFPTESRPLDIPPTRYAPRGLLLLTVGVGAAVGAAVDAIGGALGFEPSDPNVKAVVYTPPDGRNYINELREKLLEVQKSARPLELQWLQTTWKDYYLEDLQYTRQAGLEAGRFGLTLKHVRKVQTKTAEVEDPLAARLLPEIGGGVGAGGAANVPAPKLNDDAAAGKKQSLLDAGLGALGL